MFSKSLKKKEFEITCFQWKPFLLKNNFRHQAVGLLDFFLQSHFSLYYTTVETKVWIYFFFLKKRKESILAPRQANCGNIKDTQSLCFLSFEIA